MTLQLYHVDAKSYLLDFKSLANNEEPNDSQSKFRFWFIVGYFSTNLKFYELRSVGITKTGFYNGAAVLW